MALAFVVRRPLPMEGTFRPFRWWATPHRRAMVSIFWEGESPIRGPKGQKCRCHRHRTGPLGVDHCRRGGGRKRHHQVAAVFILEIAKADKAATASLAAGFSALRKGRPSGTSPELPTPDTSPP